MAEKSYHILCADDDPDTCNLLTFLLSNLDYQVTAAGSVAEALALITKGGFDLLILDNQFPDGTGVDLCKQIRASGLRTPVLFLSASAHKTDITAAVASGANDYLTKPVDLNVLLDAIERLLGIKKKIT